jgi:hypothetical protein
MPRFFFWLFGGCRGPSLSILYRLSTPYAKDGLKNQGSLSSAPTLPFQLGLLRTGQGPDNCPNVPKPIRKHRFTFTIYSAPHHETIVGYALARAS